MSTLTASSPMADGTSAGLLLEPTTQSFIDALTAAGGHRSTPSAQRRPATSWLERRPSPWRN
jgi:hypothetical protein